MQQAEQRSFVAADETREFPNGRAEIVKIAGGEVGRLIFEPGWRWSNDVKPIAQTESCLAPHFQYHVAGQLAIRMDDGSELVARPGDVTSLPSGHDAWVVGDDPVVTVDWFGAGNYATAEPRTSITVKVVEEFGAAWAAHDLETTLALLTDDCVFDATGPAPDGIRYVGPDAIRAAWQSIFDDRSAVFEAEETFAAGDRVVQLWRYSWDGGHIRGIDVFTVRGEKVSEKLSYVKG
jgi:ketosteroid isomerase-like protein